MTLSEAMNKTKPVKEMTDAEIKERLNVTCSYKCWAGLYYELDHEQQARACRQWVKEDVFGVRG